MRFQIRHGIADRLCVVQKLLFWVLFVSFSCVFVKFPTTHDVNSKRAREFFLRRRKEINIYQATLTNIYIYILGVNLIHIHFLLTPSRAIPKLSKYSHLLSNTCLSIYYVGIRASVHWTSVDKLEIEHGKKNSLKTFFNDSIYYLIIT